MRPRTLIVARDPGAANALTPVAQAGPATVIGLDHARAFFERVGIKCVGPGSDENPEIIVQWLDQVQPKVILTGTSLKVAQDQRWWQVGQERGVRTVALLDHWTAYQERFSLSAPFDCLPDVVAVMDVRAQERMIDLGCPATRLIITGQPAFDTLIRGDLPERVEIRRQWGASDDEWVIVFASEPQAHDWGACLGYNEGDALQIVLDSLRGLPVQLIVRLHPRETPERLQPTIKNALVPTRLETRLAPRSVLAGADTVIGMTSIFLLEAALAGRPTLSVQPGRIVEWTEHFPGLIATVSVPWRIREWLTDPAHRRCLEHEARVARNRAAGFTDGSTDRVWALLSKQCERSDSYNV